MVKKHEVAVICKKVGLLLLCSPQHRHTPSHHTQLQEAVQQALLSKGSTAPTRSSSKHGEQYFELRSSTALAWKQVS